MYIPIFFNNPMLTNVKIKSTYVPVYLTKSEKQHYKRGPIYQEPQLNKPFAIAGIKQKDALEKNDQNIKTKGLRDNLVQNAHNNR